MEVDRVARAVICAAKIVAAAWIKVSVGIAIALSYLVTAATMPPSSSPCGFGILSGAGEGGMTSPQHGPAPNRNDAGK